MAKGVINGQGGKGLAEFFGDGSDGALNTTGDVTLTSTLDGDMLVKQYTDIIVNTGDSLTVSNPCQGLILYATGDVVIDGTVDMSKKGANVRADLTTPLMAVDIEKGTAAIVLAALANTFGGRGGNGGYGGEGDTTYARRSYAGTAGLLRELLGGLGAGGGGGGGANGPTGAKGGPGGHVTSPYQGRTTAFPTTINYVGSHNATYPGQGGGNGQGGTGVAERQSTAVSNGGYGGACYGAGGGGGGASSLTGGASNGESGGDGEYAGGFILIIAKGNITINGQLEAVGGVGGDGGDATIGFPTNYGNYYGGGGGGGGAGGGVIALFHKGSFANSGSLLMHGGAGGKGGARGNGYDPDKGGTGAPGSTGSVGTSHIQQL